VTATRCGRVAQALTTVALLAAAAAGCAKDRRTLLFLNLESAPADTRAVDVQMTLAGRHAAVTLREPDGSAIAFPTGDVIDIGSGSGLLEVVASARDNAGQEQARAAGSVAIVAGESSALALALARGSDGTGPDLATPAADLAGADLAGADLAEPDVADLAATGATAPGPPLNVKAVAGALSATIAWTAPVSDGGSAIVAYVVTSTPDNVQAIAFPPALTTTMNGLRAAVTYTFTVRARNGVGDGPASTASNGITTPDNLAKTATASASSTYPAETYSVTRVKDGKLTATVGGAYSWTNVENALPAWLELDFGTTRALTLAQLYTSAGYPIRDYQVQVWNGASWVVAATVTGNSSLVRAHDLTGFSGSRLRIYGTSGPSWQPQYVRINELEVY
jgi:hypothetical protein